MIIGEIEQFVLTGSDVELRVAYEANTTPVVRERVGNHQPYSGLVPLETGTVAQDLAHYLAESEQSQSAVALGVFLDGGSIQAAGGFLVQALPGAREEDVEQAEATGATMAPESVACLRETGSSGA